MYVSHITLYYDVLYYKTTTSSVRLRAAGSLGSPALVALGEQRLSDFADRVSEVPAGVIETLTCQLLFVCLLLLVVWQCC